MLYVFFAIFSAICLGLYDVMKKLSVRGNNVLIVLLLNTLFGTLLLCPVIVSGLAEGYYGLGNTWVGHLLLIVKALIVLASWIMGYFAIKHLPLTVQGPIGASRPVMVLVGALLIYGEKLTPLQWVGVVLGFLSLFLISRIGAREGFTMRGSAWILLAIGSAVMGALSALYDKFLLIIYRPLEVQAWYTLYQCLMMSAVVGIMLWCKRRSGKEIEPFQWRWTILLISVFLTMADMAYFYALSLEDSMIAVVSMIRRGSVIVSFLYGVLVLHEKNVGRKAVDLGLLLVSLACLVIGSIN